MIHFILAFTFAAVLTGSGAGLPNRADRVRFPTVAPVASSEHLKDGGSKQSFCSMYANNFTAGAWSRWKGIPKIFKNLPREKFEMLRQEHSMLPGDAMYIIELDSLPKERSDVVKGQMLDGYKMMEENIGNLHGEEPNWKSLTENVFNGCMNGEQT